MPIIFFNNKKHYQHSNLENVVFLADFDGNDYNGSDTIIPRIGDPITVGASTFSASNPYGVGSSFVARSKGFAIPLPAGVWANPEFVLEFWFRHDAYNGVYKWGSDHRVMFQVGNTAAISSRGIWMDVGSHLVRGLGASRSYTDYNNSRWIHHVIAKGAGKIVAGFSLADGTGSLGTTVTAPADLIGNYLALDTRNGRDYAKGLLSSVSLKVGSGVASSYIDQTVYTVPSTRLV